MKSLPRKNAIASGRRRPWVSEMSPTRSMAAAAHFQGRALRHYRRDWAARPIRFSGSLGGAVGIRRPTSGRDPVAAGFHVVVSGHSHRPSVKEREGVLYVNPGSSGPRRFKLPVAVAELLVNGNSVRAKVVELDVESQPPLERRRLTTRRHSRRG